MTKKDFQLIAQTILAMDFVFAKDGGPASAEREAVACQFADALSSTNPLFKRDLFIQAATGVVPVTARKARVTVADCRDCGGQGVIDRWIGSAKDGHGEPVTCPTCGGR